MWILKWLFFSFLFFSFSFYSFGSRGLIPFFLFINGGVSVCIIRDLVYRGSAAPDFLPDNVYFV